MIISAVFTLLQGITVLIMLALVGVGFVWLLPIACGARELMGGVAVLQGAEPNRTANVFGLVGAVFTCNPIGFVCELVAMVLLTPDPPPVRPHTSSARPSAPPPPPPAAAGSAATSNALSPLLLGDDMIPTMALLSEAAKLRPDESVEETALLRFDPPGGGLFHAVEARAPHLDWPAVLRRVEAALDNDTHTIDDVGVLRSEGGKLIIRWTEPFAFDPRLIGLPDPDVPLAPLVEQHVKRGFIEPSGAELVQSTEDTMLWIRQYPVDAFDGPSDFLAYAALAGHGAANAGVPAQAWLADVRALSELPPWGAELLGAVGLSPLLFGQRLGDGVYHLDSANQAAPELPRTSLFAAFEDGFVSAIPAPMNLRAGARNTATAAFTAAWERYTSAGGPTVHHPARHEARSAGRSYENAAYSAYALLFKPDTFEHLDDFDAWCDTHTAMMQFVAIDPDTASEYWFTPDAPTGPTPDATLALLMRAAGDLLHAVFPWVWETPWREVRLRGSAWGEIVVVARTEAGWVHLFTTDDGFGPEDMGH